MLFRIQSLYSRPGALSARAGRGCRPRAQRKASSRKGFGSGCGHSPPSRSALCACGTKPSAACANEGITPSRFGSGRGHSPLVPPSRSALCACGTKQSAACANEGIILSRFGSGCGHSPLSTCRPCPEPQPGPGSSPGYRPRGTRWSARSPRRRQRSAGQSGSPWSGR